MSETKTIKPKHSRKAPICLNLRNKKDNTKTKSNICRNAPKYVKLRNKKSNTKTKSNINRKAPKYLKLRKKNSNTKNKIQHQTFQTVRNWETKKSNIKIQHQQNISKMSETGKLKEQCKNKINQQLKHSKISASERRKCNTRSKI